MGVSASECLSFDIEIAERQGAPLRTHANAVERVGGTVTRMCVGCNLTCSLTEEPEGPPRYVREGDEEGLRAACPLPPAKLPEVALESDG